MKIKMKIHALQCIRNTETDQEGVQISAGCPDGQVIMSMSYDEAKSFVIGQEINVILSPEELH